MHPFTKKSIERANALKKAREKDPSLNRSIHKRVVNGRTRFAKVNTCK